MLPLKDHNPTSTIPLVTYALVAINTLVMLYASLLSPTDQQVFAIRHGFIPARVAQLNHPEVQTLEVPLVELVRLRTGEIGREKVGQVELANSGAAVGLSILTCMFLHGGWMHLAGNMWFLWIFGNNIEDRLGHVLYAGFYLIGGLIATACHWFYDPASGVPVVGASGAVSTILGAYAVTYPRATVSTVVFFGFITMIEVPAIAWLLIWLGGQLVSAFSQSDLGVAVWAHIGGFAAGVLLMPVLTRVVPLRKPATAGQEGPFDFHSPGKFR